MRTKDIAKLSLSVHKKFCAYDHADECSFYYEVKDDEHDFTRYGHKAALENTLEFFNEHIKHVFEDDSFILCL